MRFARLFGSLVFFFGAPNLHGQSAEAAEIAQLRSELQRALVRIQLLERLVLAAPAKAPARTAHSTSSRPAPDSQARSFMTPSVVDPSPSDVPGAARRAATTSSMYIRGPKGGCYTLSASGTKRYVDRSLCN